MYVHKEKEVRDSSPGAGLAPVTDETYHRSPWRGDICQLVTALSRGRRAALLKRRKVVAPEQEGKSEFEQDDDDDGCRLAGGGHEEKYR